MRLVNSVAAKLIALIVGSLVLFFGCVTLIALRSQSQTTRRILTLNGAQLADLVAGATRDAMLRNDRGQIVATISTLARQREIERIRVLDKEGRIAHSSQPGEVGQVLDMQAEQCVTCHGQAEPPKALTAAEMVRETSHDAKPVLGITQVIRNEQECSGGSCHVHPGGQELLGVLDITMQLQPYEEARRASRWRMAIAFILGILLASTVVAFATRSLVHQPVKALIGGAEALAGGDLSVRVPETRRDELGRLARTFNHMARDLEVAHSELVEWGQTLEQRVFQKTAELERAQQQIIQVEKMASLGRLAAVVAHEINNPLSSVVTYAKVLLRRIQGQSEAQTEATKDNVRHLDSIVSEASRCGGIVSQLLSFARQREGEFAPVNLNTIVDKALFLVHHKLELASVEAVCEPSPENPVVEADAAQIQQALMALLINASEAMEQGGRVTVRTRPAEGGAVLEVEDTGPGMAPDVAAHAFEPFFTTKSGGHGVGLGLSVVFSIVKTHGGKIDLVTEPGHGCRFTIFLPSHPPEEQRS